MRTSGDWPDYLLQRAGRLPTAGCGIVAGSTPVVSFGPPVGPSVATLGINPSSAEFLGRGGTLLAGAERRLATLASLGIDRHEDVDRCLATQIVDDCAAYFTRRPYRWFTPLDRILRASLGVSYFDDTACRLDLVQWATDPLWGKLPEAARARLLTDDRPFLVRQLRAEHFRVVLVNGRTAMHWVERAGITRWREVAQLPGPPPAVIHRGDATDRTFVGWSCNLQSQPGAMCHSAAIEHAVALLAAPAMSGPQDRREDAEMSLERGTHVRSGSELMALLSDWIARTRDETIGDVAFGRAPWIKVDTPLGPMDLNADTRRSAVEAFLEHARRGDGSFELHVVANRRGRINKVVLDAGRKPLEGWYAYLREETQAPTSMRLW